MIQSQPFKNEQRSSPSDKQISVLLGLLNAKEMIKAEQFCSQLLHVHPHSLVLLNIYGAVLKEQGRLQEAVESFDKAIQLKPDYVEAYYNRGVLFQELGKLEKAKQSYDQAIQLKHDYTEAYNNCGVALQDLGQFREAMSYFDQAIRQNSDYAQAYNNRGVTLKGLGRLEEAMQNCDKAIQIKPDYTEAYINRGNVFKEMQLLEPALNSYNKAKQLNPDFALAFNNCGVTLKELGRMEEAVHNYNKAIQIKSDYAEAYNNLGAVLQETGKLKSALRNCDKAIELKPDYAEAYINRGNVLFQLGKLDEAINSSDKAIQLKDDYAEAYYNRGIALQELGQLGKAIKSYNKAIQLKSNYVQAYYNLTIIKKFKPDDIQIETMENLLSDPGLTENEIIHLWFALAKIYEGLGDYDKSFNYLKEGNSRRKKELNYNINDGRRLITKIKDIFSSGKLPNEEKSFVVKSPIQPIFIVGMPRSGTSLVEQILATHSKIHGAGELECMGNLVFPIFSTLQKQATNQPGSEISQNQIKSIYHNYIKELKALNVPEKIISDKMPLNFLWIGFILNAFPEAKIINLNRDPRATCWSIFKHYFSSNGNGFAYDLQDIVDFYKLYLDLMKFWRERFSNNIYDINYEYLTENQEKETHGLLDFCGLDWEEECLNFHKVKRAVRTASVAQVRKKMYQGSSEAWKKYETQLQPMLKMLENNNYDFNQEETVVEVLQYQVDKGVEMKEQNVILNFDDKQYNVEDLSDDAKIQVQNIQIVDEEIKRLNTRLAIAQTAKNTYTQALNIALADIK